jgi:hypothetical protein
MSGQDMAFCFWVRRKYPTNARQSHRYDSVYRRWFYQGAWEQWRTMQRGRG